MLVTCPSHSPPSARALLASTCRRRGRQLVSLSASSSMSHGAAPAAPAGGSIFSLFCPGCGVTQLRVRCVSNRCVKCPQIFPSGALMDGTAWQNTHFPKPDVEALPGPPPPSQASAASSISDTAPAAPPAPAPPKAAAAASPVAVAKANSSLGGSPVLWCG